MYYIIYSYYIFLDKVRTHYSAIQSKSNLKNIINYELMYVLIDFIEHTIGHWVKNHFERYRACIIVVMMHIYSCCMVLDIIFLQDLTL